MLLAAIVGIQGEPLSAQNANALEAPAPPIAQPDATNKAAIEAEVQRLRLEAEKAAAERRPPEAGRLYLQALSIATKELGERTSQSHFIRRALVKLYFEAKQYEDASSMSLDAVLDAQKVFGTDSREAILATVDWLEAELLLGKDDNAKEVYGPYFTQLDRLKLFDDHELTGRITEIANLRSEGRIFQAESFLRFGLFGDPVKNNYWTRLFMAMASGLVSVFQERGKYDDAENFLTSVSEGASIRFKNDLSKLLPIYTQWTKLFIAQRRYADALDMASVALSKVRHAFADNSDEVLIARVNYASSASRAGLHKEAIEQYQFALAHPTVNEQGYEIIKSHVELGLAAAYNDAKQYTEAESLARIALARYMDDKNAGTAERNRARQEIARALRNTGRHQAAIELLREAYDTTYEKDEMTREQATLARDIAQTYLSGSSTASEALPFAAHNVDFIRWRRNGARPDAYAGAQRRREREEIKGEFLLYADALWAARSPKAGDTTAEALAAAQEEAINPVDEAVAEAAARNMPATGALADLLRERRELQDSFALANEEYALLIDSIAGPKRTRRFALYDLMTEINEKLEAVSHRLTNEFPEYDALVRPAPLALPDMQRVLRVDEAILLLVPGTRGSHLFVVSSTSVAWQRAEITENQIQNDVTRLLHSLNPAAAPTTAETSSTVPPFDRVAAHRLYSALIKPLEGALRGKKHVFIVAAGPLSNIPLGVLVTKAPTGRDTDPHALRETSWFADSHALVQIPSAQTLSFLRHARPADSSGSSTKFAGFGDPILHESEPALAAETDLLAGAGRAARAGEALGGVEEIRRLSRLKFAAAELEAMRAVLGARADSVRLGEAATERNFRSADLMGTGVIAIATHGLTAGEIATIYEPGLVFTPPEEPTDEDDGFLTASEITALKMDADWVILSACNTAAGNGHEGASGLSGLARAFFFAGARSLLVSHWPVLDEVAADLTTGTLRRLFSDPNLSRAEALQLTMRHVRNTPDHDGSDTWAHPRAWAPFSLVGDVR